MSAMEPAPPAEAAGPARAAPRPRPLARQLWKAASAVERLSLDDAGALGPELVALIDAEAKLKAALGRVMASELVAISSGDEFKAAVLLWCRAWKQVPAASLPDDERVLAAFAGCSLAKWRRIRAVALRGFVRCSDGRLYHRVLAEDAERAFARQQAYRARRAADQERLREWRSKSHRARHRIARPVEIEHSHPARQGHRP